MNVNRQRELDSILSQLKKSGTRPRLFLHACCAPCSSYVVQYLKEFFDITVFFYNPNIQPATEYRFRLEEERRLMAEWGIPVLAEEEEPTLFFDTVRGHEDDREGGERCNRCFRLRLTRTAERAKEGNFDYFCTTLSVSPLKNAAAINEIGLSLEKDFGVKWLPSDFKKKGGYLRSVELSAEYGLYRQNYCGCVFSRRKNPAESM